MAVWTAEAILRFMNNAESDFNDSYPCIIARHCLDVQLGVPDYILPDYITNIKRITYQGTKLDPMPHRYFRTMDVGNQVSKPYWYIYNNLGQNTIRLFPTPHENLSTVEIGLWDINIESKCIVEFIRTPNEAINLTIPLYVRRRLLKVSVLKDAFSMENQGQNLKASKYFEIKWSAWKVLYGGLLQSLLSKPRKLVISDPSTYQNFPAAPVLPIDRFGVGVRPGE